MHTEKAASSKPLSPMLAALDFASTCDGPPGKASPCWRTAAEKMTAVCTRDSTHRTVYVLCPEHAIVAHQEIAKATQHGQIACGTCMKAGLAIPRLISWDAM